MKNEYQALCCNCIDNNDGSHTCLGVSHERCKMGLGLPVNDYDADVSIEVFYMNGTDENWKEFQDFLNIERKPSENLIRLLRRPPVWDE